jgi:2'-5' RNA ligase
MSKAPESWRLFIAIELSQDIRRRIKAHIERLRAAAPDVRVSWTREENLHLTLKFLGDTPVERAEAVSQALKAAANQVTSFEMEIKDCGAFPPRGKPNVLWIGIHDPSDNLNKLHAALEKECAKAGFAQDERPFHPHLTIARIRHSQGTRHLSELHQELGCDEMAVEVTEVCLIRSELSSAGSRYTIIARHELGH